MKNQHTSPDTRTSIGLSVLLESFRPYIQSTLNKYAKLARSKGMATVDTVASGNFIPAILVNHMCF